VGHRGGPEGRDPDDRVLTGGAYSEAELREAGAVGVFESVAELKDRLDETPLS
jgi:hypothetical protein